MTPNERKIMQNPLDELEKRNQRFMKRLAVTAIVGLGIAVIVLHNKNQELQTETFVALRLLNEAGLNPRITVAPLITTSTV